MGHRLDSQVGPTQLQGTFSVRSNRDRVFSFFLNPEALSSCIDEPHTIEVVDADHFKGSLRAGIGVVRGTFTWTATITDRHPPERARVLVHGSGLGGGFDIDATVEALESEGQTTLSWHAAVAVRGRVASMGARLLRGAIDRKTKSFFENARFRLESA